MEIKISCFKEWKILVICGLLFWLIIPTIIIIIKVMEVNRDIWTISEDKVHHEYGLFSKNEEVFYMKDITEAKMNQSLGGRIFHYGDIGFKIIGKRGQMVISFAKHPEESLNKFKQMLDEFSKKNVQEILVSSN